MKGVLLAGDENEMDLLGRTLCNCKVNLNAVSFKKIKVVGFFPFPGFGFSICGFVLSLCLLFVWFVCLVCCGFLFCLEPYALHFDSLI